MAATEAPPRIPPLALVGLLGVATWLLARVLPQLAFAVPGRIALSATVALAGLALCLAGVLPFRRAGTTVDPRRPERASVLVTTGIYSVTRNPMYLGFLLVLAAWGAYLSNAAALVIAPVVFVLYLDRLQIPAEERALSQAFGKEYEEYARRVRRWI